MTHGSFQLLGSSAIKHQFIKISFYFVWYLYLFSEYEVSLLIQYQNFTFCLIFPSKSVRFKYTCYLILCNWYNSVVAFNFIIQAKASKCYFPKPNILFQIYQILHTFLHFLCAWTWITVVFGGHMTAFALCLKDWKSILLLKSV